MQGERMQESEKPLLRTLQPESPPPRFGPTDLEKSIVPRMTQKKVAVTAFSGYIWVKEIRFLAGKPNFWPQFRVIVKYRRWESNPHALAGTGF
jgi:hypothetical protein